MTRLVAVVLIGIAGIIVAASTVEAGAKGGKIRWSEKRSGASKWYPAIKVPAAEGDKPGVHVLKITYKGDELAEFFAIGDGDTDIDVVVKDSNDKVVAKDVDPPANEGGGSDLCVCRWRPTQDDEFTVIIINHGKVYNMVTAASN